MGAIVVSESAGKRPIFRRRKGTVLRRVVLRCTVLRLSLSWLLL